MNSEQTKEGSQSHLSGEADALRDLVKALNHPILCALFGEIEDSGTAESLRLWSYCALWFDVRDEALANRALAVARQRLAQSLPTPPGRTARPVRLARAIILPDIKRGRAPAAGFSPTHYARLLIASLRG